MTELKIAEIEQQNPWIHEDERNSNFKFLWQKYGLADPAKLTEKARQLRLFLRAVVRIDEITQDGQQKKLTITIHHVQKAGGAWTTCARYNTVRHPLIVITRAWGKVTCKFCKSWSGVHVP